MKTHIARSIFDTLARLEQAVTVDSQTRAQGTPWISTNFRDTLVASLTQLRASSAEHGQVRESFLRAQKQRRSDVDQLSRLVRDFFQVLRRRSDRMGNRDALEALFKRPTRVPQWSSVIDWLQWADHIVQGEAQAQSLGYPAMVNPSAAEIAVARQRAAASEEQWSERIQLLKIQEQRLRQARETGTRSLRGLALRLRETLAREAPATRRELMRTFGFSFISTGKADRQKPSGPSRLPDLIAPLSRSAEDADPVQPQPAARLKPPQLETPAPMPIQAPEPSAVATSTAPTPPPAAVAESSAPANPPPAESSREQQPTPIDSAQPNALRVKLSRRQKKALRRAQRQDQPAAEPNGKAPTNRQAAAAA